MLKKEFNEWKNLTAGQNGVKMVGDVPKCQL